MAAEFEFTPVVIIGAPRSGTNALRDALCAHSCCATWPCDEIDYIWRYKSVYRTTDNRQARDATPAVKKFIRNAFKRRWKLAKTPNYLIEKTCANSLRIAFVQKILPEARFVVIFRDGIDVVPSAAKRWTGDFEYSKGKYLYSKAKYIPLVNIIPAILSAVRNNIFFKLSRHGRYYTWGPRTLGISNLKASDVHVLAATQWRDCVVTTLSDLKNLEKNSYHIVFYEDLVKDPRKSIIKIFDFIGCHLSEEQLSRCASKIHCREKKLEGEHSRDVMRIIAPVRKLLGY